MARKRILFTGIPGTRVKLSIDKFIEYISDTNKIPIKPLHFSIEKEMELIHCEEKGIEWKPTIWINDLLTRPYKYLLDLWGKAFESINRKVEEKMAKNPETDIFINFHTVFYHHETIEHLSFINQNLLNKFKPDVVITLIDDIYDIHSRLRGENQIFNPSLKGRARTRTEAEDAIFELLRILDWRAKEILMSRHITTALDIPNYLIAVKHPCETLYKIIYEDKPAFYLSHPITEVRRQMGRGNQIEAQQIIGEITGIGNLLSSEFPCFLPTTIDELRIKSNKKNGDYEPELLPRWEFEESKTVRPLLFIPPESRNEKDPLWESDSKSEILAPMLSVLAENIGAQMSTRDHRLVEQSKNIAVYRPCYNGNPSEGVIREIKYFRDLDSSGNRFVYLPTEDKYKLKAWILADRLGKAINEGNLAYQDPSSARGTFRLEEEEIEKIKKGADIDPIFVTQIIKDHNLLIEIEERVGLAPDRIQMVEEFKKIIVKKCEDYYQYDLDFYKACVPNNFILEEDTPQPGRFFNFIITINSI
jgi:hypothetical protein